MKFKLIIIFLLTLSGTICFGQEVIAYSVDPDDTSNTPTDTVLYYWNEVISYDVDSNEVWMVDGMGNVFSSHGGAINKYDTAGVLKFSQSIKSLGKMQQILSINSMKLLHFSKEQQTLCYLDNTLTQFDDCIELADHEIVDAGLVSSSSRPDMVWVYDNLNSKLVLLPLVEGQQGRQEIDNLSGILGIDNISQILERQNVLYVVSKGKGIYLFDLYGSLLSFREEKGVKCIDVFGTALFILLENELKVKWMKEDKTSIIPLPMEGIEGFVFSNQQFYLRTSQHVHKFDLQIVK